MTKLERVRKLVFEEKQHMETLEAVSELRECSIKVNPAMWFKAEFDHMPHTLPTSLFEQVEKKATGRFRKMVGDVLSDIQEEASRDLNLARKRLKEAIK